jgi:hypothetical protein
LNIDIWELFPRYGKSSVNCANWLISYKNFESLGVSVCRLAIASVLGGGSEAFDNTLVIQLADGKTVANRAIPSDMP